MGLGEYDGLGTYCDPHTASSVFLVLIFLINLQRLVCLHVRSKVHSDLLTPLPHGPRIITSDVDVDQKRGSDHFAQVKR